MKSVYGLLAFITVCQLGVFGRDTQGWFNDAVLAEAKEEQYGPARNAAMLATCFLLDGVPMLYNGQEIADVAPLLQKFSPFRGGCLGENSLRLAVNMSKEEVTVSLSGGDSFTFSPNGFEIREK